MTNFYQITESTKNEIINMINQDELSIVDGGILDEFENNFASFFGHEYGVATCNGTSAIHLAYFAINIQKGDEVLMATYGFHAMVTPLLQLGGRPIFCDIDKETLTIDVGDMERKITSKTKAVMVLQPWGNLANVDSLITIAIKHNLILISDSSHAHGALWNNKPLGEYYDVICASLGKGKLISGGELGVLTTNNKEFRDRALLYSHTNRVPKVYLTDKYKDISNIIGIKYRPHPFALLLANNQLKDFEERNNRLLANINKLLAVISKMEEITILKSNSFSKRVYWKIVLIAPEKIIKQIKDKSLGKEIVFEDNHYKTLLHEDTIITNYYSISQKKLPVANKLETMIIQIDAIQLYDIKTLNRYINFFETLYENE